MRTRTLLLLVAVTLVLSVTACAASAQTSNDKVVAAPTALPISLGEHPVYVLDVLNGRLISELIGIDADTRKALTTLSLRYTPEILFSADGQKMYVLDAYFSRTTRGEPRDVLSVFDAKSLEIQTDDIPADERLRYKIFPGGFDWFFASPDGKYLFIGKYGKPDISKLRLTVVDASTYGQVAEYLFPTCDDRRVLPMRDGRLLCLAGPELQVLDALTAQKQSSIAIPAGTVAFTLLSPQRDRWYRFDHEGRVTVVDLAALPMQLLQENVPFEIPARHTLGWSNQVVMSQDGTRVYIGFAPTGGDLFGSGMADVIRAYDPRTWKLLGELRPANPARYMALSNDGSQLYTTNSEQQTLTIYNALALQELRVMEDLGISPSQILIPPQ